MKKLILFTVVFLSIVGFSGCRNNVDYVDDDALIDDEFIDEEIPEGAAITVRNTDYQTSINEIDTRLYNTLDELDSRVYDENDENYLYDRRDYYVKTSTAYETALNDLNRVNYTDEYSDYHNSLVNYYQSGYDTYYNLSNRYQGFQTIEDEIAYRNDVGDEAFYVGDDVRSAYDEALIGLNIRR